MLGTTKFIKQIALHSRAAVKNTSHQWRFGKILKCGYGTRADEPYNIVKTENLCNAYIKEKNVAKIEEMSKSSILSDYIHHNIINMHIEMGSTEMALNHLYGVRQYRPNFKLNRNEAAQLARVMFKDNRDWSDIIRIFTENKQPRLQGQNVSAIHFLLQTVAEAGDPSELNELCDVLINNNFLVKDSHTAGFMVKVHVVNKDLPEAVRIFEQQFEERRFTSYQLPLMMALIVANDIEKLAKVFKLVKMKWSESDALLHLAASFIQIGNISQARVLLENNSSRISDHSFWQYCQRNHKYGEFSILEGWLAATEGLEYDRSNIYSYLLEHFCAYNKTNEALELWYKQRAHNEEPTIFFLQRLATYLYENDHKIPFHVPNAAPLMVSSHLSPAKITEMKNALQIGDVDTALKLWTENDVSTDLGPQFERSTIQHMSLTYDLIRCLMKSNRNVEAVEITIQTIKLGRKVNETTMRELVQRLANDGDSQSLERLGDLLPRTTKRSIHFGSQLLNVYERCGKWNEFFQTTLDKSTNANANDRINMLSLLPLLQKQSIPLNEFKEFAEKAADKGDCGPLNILWAHYFLINSPASSILYDRFEQDFPTKFQMAFLGNYLVEVADEIKIEELLEFAKTNKKDVSAINIMILITRMMK